MVPFLRVVGWVWTISSPYFSPWESICSMIISLGVWVWLPLRASRSWVRFMGWLLLFSPGVAGGESW